MDDESPGGPSITRRDALGLTCMAMAATLTSALAAAPPPAPVGQPFDDGTYFDDGSGWID